MPLPHNEHRYNDDLLVHERDRLQAKAEFPHIFNVLYDQALCEDFKETDARANRAKYVAQLSGLWAIVLAGAALAIAASAIKWEDSKAPIPTVLVAVSAAMGVAAALIAWFGLLHGSRKESWLLARLRTELLRQFHFQTLVFRLNDIADLSANRIKLETFLEKRDVWFNGLLQILNDRLDGKLSAVISPNGAENPWLHDGPRKPKIPAGFDTHELFSAYQKLRFRAQLDYCEHKLRERSSTWRFKKMPIRQQARLLSAIWLFAFGVLVLLHVLFLGAVAIHELPHDGSWWHVAVVWLALLAIEARAADHGMALPREIERYEDYAASTRSLQARFELATSDEEKLEAMIEMERLAFDELRNFLRAHHEANFTM